MTIGETIRTLLEEHELTQKQLALALNVAPSTLGGYVQGTSEPDVATLKRIAAYFQVSMDYLLDFSQKSDSLCREKTNCFASFALYLKRRESYFWNRENCCSNSNKRKNCPPLFLTFPLKSVKNIPSGKTERDIFINHIALVATCMRALLRNSSTDIAPKSPSLR